MEPEGRPFQHIRAFLRWARRQPVKNWTLDDQAFGTSVSFTCASLAEAVHLIGSIPWTIREPKLQPTDDGAVLHGTAWGMPVSVNSREQIR